MEVTDGIEGGQCECSSCGSLAVTPARLDEGSRPSYQGEPIFYMGRPKRKGQLGLYVLGLSFLLVGIACLFLPGRNSDNPQFSAFLVLGTVGWLFLIAAEISVRSTTYLLTPKTVLMQTGWLPRSRIEIPIARLRRIGMRRGFRGGRAGLGRIGFTTSEGPGWDFVWWGVLKPELVRDLVLKSMKLVASSETSDKNP